jgi:Lon protease-like protein
LARKPDEDLPRVIPIFPLQGALLLPRGQLPLNIFEPRYLAMTEDALGAGRMFGMIQPDETQPEGANGPALYRVGCLGRLISFSETEDGRFLITLAGVARFAVGRELEMHRGYRRVRADYTAFADDLRLDASPAIDRGPIMDALRGYFTRAGIDANWEAVQRLPDPTLVVTLSMLCPFAPVEKQALLEAASEADRASTLLALLRMGGTEPDPAGSPRSVS